MLQQMDETKAQHCIEAAEASPLSQPGMNYPEWYLRRWHFLPEGYLSRRSAAMYEWCIRHIYYVGAERRAVRALAAAVRLQHPEQVLELGCGPGHTVEALAVALPYSEITGLDLSPFQLERARQRCLRFGGQVRLLHADALALPQPNASFEAVVAAHVAGHVPAEAARRVIDQAARVLKPRGKLYLLEHTWHRLPETGLRPAWSRNLRRIGSRLLCYQKHP